MRNLGESSSTKHCFVLECQVRACTYETLHSQRDGTEHHTAPLQALRSPPYLTAIYRQSRRVRKGRLTSTRRAGPFASYCIVDTYQMRADGYHCLDWKCHAWPNKSRHRPLYIYNCPYTLHITYTLFRSLRSATPRAACSSRAWPARRCTRGRYRRGGSLRCAPSWWGIKLFSSG